MSRIWNFSAGPAALPEEVLQQAQEEHQQPYPKGVIPGHVQGEVAAQGGGIAPVLLWHYLCPGL